jgi:hypothetical protein
MMALAVVDNLCGQLPPPLRGSARARPRGARAGSGAVGRAAPCAQGDGCEPRAPKAVHAPWDRGQGGAPWPPPARAARPGRPRPRPRPASPRPAVLRRPLPAGTTPPPRPPPGSHPLGLRSRRTAVQRRSLRPGPRAPRDRGIQRRPATRTCRRGPGTSGSEAGSSSSMLHSGRVSHSELVLLN